jgi:glycosyltransferase involved in cell wall biosynthesis
MRIAQLAPPWFTVPPSGYGGIELVVALLADGLVARGHEVTLFAAPGSTTTAKLVSSLVEAPDPSLLGNVWFDTFHVLSAYLQMADFDVVHDHSGIVGPALGAVQGRPPVVHTLHGPWTAHARRYYELLQHRVDLVAISETQRRDNPDLRYAATVHNGIDVAHYPYREDKEDFLVYIGRANPEKGPTRAIEVARRAGLPLKMIVKKSEPFERAYWDDVVTPMLTHDVEVLEAVTHATKVDLLSRARAMVFPIDWPEPFGLVMVEAMACGTPVLTCPTGAALEIVEDGVTGALRESMHDLADAVADVGKCSAAACRARVVERFSAEQMVVGYERVLEAAVARPGLLSRWRGALRPSR